MQNFHEGETYVSYQVSTSICIHPWLDLADRVVQTALYSIQRLICIAMSTKRLRITLKRSYPWTNIHSQCSLFFALLTHLPAGSCGTKYFCFVTGSFHTNLVFLSTVTASRDEKAEVEPDISCTLCSLRLWVCSPCTWRRSPESTISGA